MRMRGISPFHTIGSGRFIALWCLERRRTQFEFGEIDVLLRNIIGILLLLHGVIHGILAVIPNPDAAEPVAATFFSGWARPWLHNNLSGRGLQTIAIVLAVMAGIGFITGGLALFDVLLPHDWWRALAIAASVVSMGLCLLFWNTNLVVGPVVAVGIIVALVIVRWPTEATLGF
jgi:hypothetical protein